MPIKKSTKPTTTTTKPKVRTRKGRKKFHYITGTHTSPKSKHPVEYRSSWELYVCKHLDDDNAVDDLLYFSLSQKSFIQKNIFRVLLISDGTFDL
jgi:hypothetical protein